MVAESTHCSSLPNQQQYTHGRPPHEIGAAEGRDLSSAVSLPAAVLGSRRSSRVGRRLLCDCNVPGTAVGAAQCSCSKHVDGEYCERRALR